MRNALPTLLTILLLPLVMAFARVADLARPLASPPYRPPRIYPFACRWTSTPCLIVEPSVDDSLAALAAQTWSTFRIAFAPRLVGLADVHLQASYTLPARAGYDPDAAVITVRVPGSAAKLQAALIHEWAHHLEFQRPQALDALRPAFLEAEGFSPETPWRPSHAPVTADVWADIPSEHFAEAAIDVVLGRNATPTQIRVQPAAVALVANWAAGKSLSAYNPTVNYAR